MRNELLGRRNAAPGAEHQARLVSCSRVVKDPSRPPSKCVSGGITSRSRWKRNRSGLEMTRKELIERVRAGLGDEELGDRQVAAVIDRVFEEIAASLREEGRYTHPGFGTFTVRVQAAKTGRNPRTGE